MAKTDIKKTLTNILGKNSNKLYYFVKWYVESKDKSKEDFNKNCKYNAIVEYETAMQDWLIKKDVQDAIKEYIKMQRNVKMFEIYESMLDKAISGDVKSAEWVEKFFKSDFFGNEQDEIDNFLDGINIPALGGK